MQGEREGGIIATIVANLVASIVANIPSFSFSCTLTFLPDRVQQIIRGPPNKYAILLAEKRGGGGYSKVVSGF